MLKETQRAAVKEALEKALTKLQLAVVMLERLSAWGGKQNGEQVNGDHINYRLPASIPPIATSGWVWA